MFFVPNKFSSIMINFILGASIQQDFLNRWKIYSLASLSHFASLSATEKTAERSRKHSDEGKVASIGVEPFLRNSRATGCPTPFENSGGTVRTFAISRRENPSGKRRGHRVGSRRILLDRLLRDRTRSLKLSHFFLAAQYTLRQR